MEDSEIGNFSASSLFGGDSRKHSKAVGKAEKATVQVGNVQTSREFLS